MIVIFEDVFIYGGEEYFNCGTVEENGEIFIILRKDDEKADYVFLKRKGNIWIEPEQKEQEDLKKIYKNDFDGFYNLIEGLEYQKRSNIFSETTLEQVRAALDQAYSVFVTKFENSKFNKNFANFNISSLIYSSRQNIYSNFIAKYSPANNEIFAGSEATHEHIVHECWHVFSTKPSILSYLVNYSSVGLSTYHFNSVKGEAINEGITQYLTEQTCDVDKENESYEMYVRIVKMMEVLFGDSLYQSFFNADRQMLYDSGKNLGYDEKKIKRLFFSSDALLKWEEYGANTYNLAYSKEEKIVDTDTHIFSVILSKYKIKKQTHLSNVQLILIDMLDVLLENVIRNTSSGEERSSYISKAINVFKDNLITSTPVQALETEFARRLSCGLDEVENKFKFLVERIRREQAIDDDSTFDDFTEKEK